MDKYTVIKSEEFSDMFEQRYVVVDTETGEIVDNAQGYGYRTKEKAYKAWSYKQNLNKNKSSDKKIKSEVRNFVKKHKCMFNQLDDMLFEAAKCGDEITTKDIYNFFEENNLLSELPCSVKVFLKFYQA